MGGRQVGNVGWRQAGSGAAYSVSHLNSGLKRKDFLKVLLELRPEGCRHSREVVREGQRQTETEEVNERTV